MPGILKQILFSGDLYSEETTKVFTTAPEDRAVEKLNISVTSVDKKDVIIRWSPVTDLPCVRNYNVSLCQESIGCAPAKELSVDQSSNELFSANNSLQECTSYYLKILPLYASKKVSERLVTFQTRFPPLTNLSKQLGPIRASVTQNLAISLTWTKVKCAKQYLIYETRDSEWILVNKTDVNKFNVKAVFCKSYHFGVRAIVGGEKSDIVPMKDKLVTQIENPEYYILPKFEVEGTLHGARLSWGHR